MTTTTRRRHQTHSEGPVAKTIEQQTKKLPSDLFLWAALGSIGLSWGLRAMDRKEDSDFVGTWAPTLLILWLYNKIVKIQGSDGDAGFGGRMGRMMGAGGEGEEE
jgi:hypothetical protein